MHARKRVVTHGRSKAVSAHEQAASTITHLSLCPQTLVAKKEEEEEEEEDVPPHIERCQWHSFECYKCCMSLTKDTSR